MVEKCTLFEFVFELEANTKLIDECWFILQGHDTVTAALTFYLYLISKNPEAQQKCYEEIVNVFGDDTEQTATLSLLNKLSYLELTIKEALRLFSPIPMIARTAIEDIKLSKNWCRCVINRWCSFPTIVIYVL